VLSWSMPNPNIAAAGKATQFGAGGGPERGNPHADVSPDQLAKRFDKLLMKQMWAAGKGKMDRLIETDLLAVVERRLKALGEVRKPKEEPPAPDSKDAAVDDSVRAAVAAQKEKKGARTSGSVAPPSTGAAPSGPSERGGG